MHFDAYEKVPKSEFFIFILFFLQFKVNYNLGCYNILTFYAQFLCVQPNSVWTLYVFAVHLRETASSKVRLQYFMPFSPAEAHPQFAAPVKILGGAPLAQLRENNLEGYLYSQWSF